MYFFLSLLIITLNVFAKEYPIKSKAPKLLNKDSTPIPKRTPKVINKESHQAKISAFSLKATYLKSINKPIPRIKVKIILKKENGSEIEAAEEYIHIDCFYKLLDKAECR